jgi:hypothetical protein
MTTSFRSRLGRRADRVCILAGPIQLIKRLPTVAASDLPDSHVRYTFEWLSLDLDEGGHYYLSKRDSYRSRNTCLTRSSARPFSFITF